MEYSRASIITSPISGQPVKPVIREIIIGDKLIKEAHYIDPASGIFIRKVVLSQEDYKKTS